MKAAALICTLSAAVVAASPMLAIMRGDTEVPGFPGERLEYRISLAPVIGSPTEVDLWIEFSHSGKSMLEFIACTSVEFEPGADRIAGQMDSIQMSLTAKGDLECRSDGVGVEEPSLTSNYHFGCESIRLPPANEAAPGLRARRVRYDLSRPIGSCEADAIRLDLLPARRDGEETRIDRSCINAFSTRGQKGRANILAATLEKGSMLIRGRASACAVTNRDATAPAIVESTAAWVRRTGRIAFELLARDDDVLATAAIEIQAGAGAIEFLPLAVREHVVDGKGGARTGFRGESPSLAAGTTVIYRALVSDATGNVAATDWRKLVLGAGEKKDQKTLVSGPEMVIILGIACVGLLCLRLVLRNTQRIDPPPLHPNDEG